MKMTAMCYLVLAPAARCLPRRLSRVKWYLEATQPQASVQPHLCASVQCSPIVLLPVQTISLLWVCANQRYLGEASGSPRRDFAVFGHCTPSRLVIEWHCRPEAASEAELATTLLLLPLHPQLCSLKNKSYYDVAISLYCLQGIAARYATEKAAGRKFVLCYTLEDVWVSWDAVFWGVGIDEMWGICWNLIRVTLITRNCALSCKNKIDGIHLYFRTCVCVFWLFWGMEMKLSSHACNRQSVVALAMQKRRQWCARNACK